MKLKFDRQDPNSYRCCFCCHVRVGTILFGLWNILMQLLLIAVLVLFTMHPDILKANPSIAVEGDGIIVADLVADRELGDRERGAAPCFTRPITREDLCVAYTLATAWLMITVALIFGVIKTRPGYLMPFFCLQVFDFCLSCLTAVGYFTYAPNIKLWLCQYGITIIGNTDNMGSSCCQGDFSGNQILDIDSDWLMLVFVTVFILTLCIKAYLIGMVWACYQYLQMKLASRSVVREYTLDPDSEMLLPPKYEEAIKMPSSVPPPPYTSD